MATEYTINARSAVAAVAASARSFRIYFQDTQNGIREGVYHDGKWTVSGKAIFYAKRLTPLSAVSWDGGNQVRIYSISEDDSLEEWCYSNGGRWVPGYLTNLKVRTAPNSSVAAVNWDGSNIRVYCQEESSNAVQEYCVGNPWTRGATLPVADQGSNLAAVSWIQNGSPHLRVYYQAADLTIHEHCYDSGWSKGGFNPGIALKNTAIAATGWNSSGVQLRVYAQDSYGLLRGYKWSGSWEKTESGSHMPVGTHMVAVNWYDEQIVRVYYQSDNGTIWEESDDGTKNQIV
ncbi:fucose-specific lectin [Trichoderma evansii]